LSPVAALTGDALMLAGWLGIFFVFRENSFTASTIALAEDQKVITTGPYAWVRHPMYAASLAMLLGIPIALGSWWGVLTVLAMLPVLIWRLLDEERFLARNLPGYIDYQGRVRYRLLPFFGNSGRSLGLARMKRSGKKEARQLLRR
jgi:protein-S-isoprenylcysteine O-methyltransferase Ste14